MSKSILLSALILIITAQSSARTLNVTKKKYEPIQRTAVANWEDPILDDKIFAEYKEQSKERSKRKVANADQFDEKTAFSSSFLNLRSELLGGKEIANGTETGKSFAGIQTADELAVLVDRFASNIDPKQDKTGEFFTLGSDAQLLAIQLAALKPFKSFIFRAKDYFGKHSALRTSIVTGLRMNSQAINIYLPTSQWRAGFAYITEPMTGMGAPINNDSDMEKFLSNELLPYVVNNTARLSAVVQKSESIWWDNKVYFSKANFVSEKDRYIRLGVAEQQLIASSATGTLASLYSLCAYSLGGLADAIAEISFKFGVDVARSADNPVTGVTAKERFAIMNKYKNTLFVLQSQEYMKRSYTQWKASYRWAATSWSELNKGVSTADSANNYLDPRTVVPYNRPITLTFDTVESLFETKVDTKTGKQKVPSSAMVNGEVVQVNLHDFFTNSPQNLAELYPVDFDTQAPAVSEKLVDSKKIKFRNYNYENPTAWSHSAYVRYFPDIQKIQGSKDATSDIQSRARILSQTWGGWIVGLPLSNLVF